MKIRSGFVSNSSSCSFTLVGVEGSAEDLEKEFELEYIDKAEDDLLEVRCNPNSDWSYIGVPLTRMGDNQTKAAFIEMVRNHFFTRFEKDVEVTICEGGWYDG